MTYDCYSVFKNVMFEAANNTKILPFFLGNMEMVMGIARHMKLPAGCQTGKQFSTRLMDSDQSLISSLDKKNIIHMCNVEGYKGMLYLTQVKYSLFS